MAAPLHSSNLDTGFTTASHHAHATTDIPPTSNSSDSSTINTANASAYEHGREDVRQSNPQGTTDPTGGIDVARAEEEFAQLNRTLSGLSREHSRLSRTNSRQSEKSKPHDVEDASSEGEEWNLEDTLRGQKEDQDASGIKGKRIGVFWDNLTVRGNGGLKNYVKVFPDAFVDFFNVPGTIMSIFGVGKKGREFDILSGFRGVVKPGEMVLVLGKPGSGCTTFLKVMANQRAGYTNIDGEVRYGPYDAAHFDKHYRGEATYNDEDDTHHPTLTVGQTLGFALDTKTPGKRPEGMTAAKFKELVTDTLLRMFNIVHTKNTIVGNQFVRGVSGGERKRVSIAEMMITASSVCCWDNSTRGLDASTALDFAKSLRVLTNIYKTTTFVSLYQASENIYQQFDKVMVIDAGRQVYLGPIAEARGYFEGLGFKEKPRQTTPDYLTGCTDAYEREYQDGRSADNAPHNAETLCKAFAESETAKKLEQEIGEYKQALESEKAIHEEFELANREAKRKHTPNHSVYSIPYYLQIWALMQRQFLIKWQDKFLLVVSWITSMGIALILGTVWLNVPKTSAGAFTRGGLLFIALLFNAFNAFSELASTMLGRAIVNKHRAYTFHRPSALWIAQIAVDMLFATVQIFAFSLIVYFMCGLARDAGSFFTFVLFIITGYLMMTLFFRTLGCVCPDFDYAMKFAATIITLFVLTSGYLIQYQDEPVWLSWIYYINALGLGFDSLMVNEFKSLSMTCTGAYLVPSGSGYGDIAHQSCTLPGSVAGSDQVSGADYIRLAFDYKISDLWRNLGIIIALIAFFLFLNATLGEAIVYGAGGRTVTFFAKEDSERKKLNEALIEKKKARQQHKTADAGSEMNIASKSVLTWENLNYDVPVPGGTRRLLNDIFGYVKPGQLTALMGASGAGKTTLLDTLAARKSIGVIQGDIFIDGKAPGIAFQRGTSYAEQLDVHEPTQTVREALRFSADLRQPYETPQSEKYAYVEEVLSLLELEDLADAIIGSPETGLSVEERKRVTIGVELAAKPELLLFLDEPTSGLDSQSAFNIVRFLRKLAGAGQAILCTIHQPNSALFENFDRLLLLQRGGETVYFGDIGKDAVVLRDYLHRHGADCPPDANPAEFMLEAIGAGSRPRMGDRDWGDIWRSSPELANVKDTISQLKATRMQEVGDAPPLEEKEYATPMWHQIKVVGKRTHLSFWRTPNYGFTRLFVHVIIALLTGLMFLNLTDSRTDLQYRVFVVFQVCVIPAIILAQVEPRYDMARLIYYREAAGKAYKQFPFSFSMAMAEMPYNVICAVGFFLPLYYIPGFQMGTDRAGYAFFIILITEIFSVTLGQMIAALTPSAFIGSLINPPITIILVLMCGVTVPPPQLPKFYKSWVYQVDPFTRLISGMVTNELHGREVVCRTTELNSFTAPSGMTCGEYMADFFAAGGPGYLVNNSTSSCDYCAYKNGDQFYAAFDIDFETRWRDLGIFMAFVGSNLILLFVGVSLLFYSFLSLAQKGSSSIELY